MLLGNFIGTDNSGTVVLGNDTGVWTDQSASDNTIGGTAAGAGNLISGNNGTGVAIGDGVRNLILGNLIGTDASGSSAISGFSFQQYGIYLLDGATNNTIGGTATGQGNIIAHNNEGVWLDRTAVDNPIRGNAIYNNTGPGIGLYGRTTANDLGDGDDGGNHIQNFPVLTAVTPLPGILWIGGNLNSKPNETYVIDFYTTSSGFADPSGYGGAQFYLGSTTVTTFAEGNISFVFAYTGNIPLRSAVTATATDSEGNTSEFALNYINNREPIAHITITNPIATI